MKIGRLITKLRKEKGYTQQDMANIMHISNKTVSKWECGLGCPDVSLWPALSKILEVDIAELLSGSLQAKQADIGKVSKANFYVCPKCGTILVALTRASVSCCGRKLQALKVHQEEHTVLEIEKVDNEYYITSHHPMEKGHSLTFIAYVSDSQILVERVYPEQEVHVYLPVLKRGKYMYAYCNQHGLYQYVL